MLRRILVAQLLTVLLDTQGADPSRLMEAFPEEFTPNRRGSDCSHEPAFPSPKASVAWSAASDDLKDALAFLVARHLVSIEADGRVVPEGPQLTIGGAEPAFSLDGREEAFGLRPLYEWSPEHGLCAALEPFEFDLPRCEA